MATTNMIRSIVFLVLAIFASASLAQNSEQDYLDAHNAARAAVGVGPLTWDDNLASYAQNYANSRIDDCDLIHSDGPYGENLAEGSGSFTALDAVQMWVDEKIFYNPFFNICLFGECLHYTQVVWRDSTKLGCARTQCNNGWWFVICSYDPAGNIIGERPY
ncbi:hypothetical protein Droror1_Dr00001218 [Drosera rotundifolia]